MTDRTELYDNVGNLVHVADNRNIDDVKAALNDKVNTYRDTVLNRGMWLYGQNWDTAERGRANVSGMTAGIAAGIPLPENFVWRSNENINVSMTAQTFVYLGAQVLNYVNMVYGASWYIKAVLDSLTTLAEVDAFDYKGHPAWPDGNMDGSKPMSVGPDMLADALVGAAYSETFAVSGGKTPFTFSISNGTALPDGLTLANATISGTPTTAGSTTFELSVTDSMTPNAAVSISTYTLTVNA